MVISSTSGKGALLLTVKTGFISGDELITDG